MNPTNQLAEAALAEKEKTAPHSRWPFFRAGADTSESDPEKGLTVTSRPMRYFAAVYGGLAMGLSICEFFSNHFCRPLLTIIVFVSTGISMIIQEVRLDGNYVRFALFVTLPLLLCISLFFSISVVSVFTYVYVLHLPSLLSVISREIILASDLLHNITRIPSTTLLLRLQRIQPSTKLFLTLPSNFPYIKRV